ncbi:MAG: tyrosine-type recombinase/integrase, partial [Desulforhopalus sp.]|nr:tyrosine-type recombinase/integrase [Desulforhopalus sp.]
MMIIEKSPEMRLFSPDGERLYLTAQERKRFLAALDEEERENRIFCQILHYTGCRPSEALELTPRRILIDSKDIVFRSLKTRKTDGKGRVKQPEFRTVPVPANLINIFDLVFDIRRLLRRQEGLKKPFWTMSRPTAYRLVQRVMDRAKIKGKQATGKGLRHGFGIALLSGPKPLPIHILAQLMGHSSSKTTEIYLQVVSE